MTAVPWPPLIKGILIKRYKRFLADVKLLDGSTVTAHTANTGSMLTCSEPGRPVYLSRSANHKRLYPYSWAMIEMPDGLVGVDTGLPNRLAALAARDGFFPGWPKYPKVVPEAKVGRGRLDLRLESPEGPTVWVEVKNCSLVQDGVAEFPDAPSVRGRRHLAELAELAQGGDRAIILILVQRAARAFRPAAAIDPAFALALGQAVSQGVELEVYRVGLSLTRAWIAERLPVLT
ncbi:MAG: DNA/RNA nuclease SfsA [Deltaproteobacteria bacterium]|jgi:sugar fermentation stimulation protein A|nr:DNA/RNA nuclease SfsA [Deltaproteobacteria bacterium]